MRNSIKRFSKTRRNSFNSDFDHQEDHLLLADIKVLPDDSRLTITPLNHEVDDEDNFDRLLTGNSFGAIPSDLAQPDDSFAIVDQLPPVAEQARPSDEHLNGPEIPFDDVPVDLGQTTASHIIGLTDAAFEPAPIAVAIEEVDNGHTIVEIGAATENAPVIPTRPIAEDAETIPDNNPAQTTQTASPQNQNSATRLLPYIAGATLAITCLLGFMIYGLKTEMAQLSKQVTVLSEKLAAKQAIEENQ